MLIDESYFVGPLTIAQLGQKAVVDSLKDYINRWEPVIMEAALGYDFYQAFLDGLDVGSSATPEQRWLDLLNGVVFNNVSDFRKRFVGFAGGQNASIIVPAQRSDLHIYGGVTPGFTVGGYTYTDATLANWNFTVELFGAGTLDPGVDWNYKAGGGIALTNTSYTVSPDEHWVIKFTGKKNVVVPSGQNLVSPLAGFIYYEYMKDLVYQTTGVGEVKSKSENSESGNPAQKLANAFNDACRQINVFWEFIQKDQYATVKVYPEWDYRQVHGYSGIYWKRFWTEELYPFTPINTFGI